jgi:hypothetical protein
MTEAAPLDGLQHIAEDLREYALPQTADHIEAYVQALRQAPAEAVLRKVLNAGDDEFYAIADDHITLDLRVELTADEVAYLRSLVENE